MRTIVKTEVIPATEAEEVQHTMYGCDHCDFESDEEDKVLEHHGKMHSFRRQLTAGGCSLYWFDKQEDAKCWLKATCGDIDSSDAGVHWSSPGWYVTESGSRPCMRGCCTDYYLMLVPVEDVLEKMKDKARKIMGTHAEISRGIKEDEPCPTS